MSGPAAVLAQVTETSLHHLLEDSWRVESGERRLDRLRLASPAGRWSVVLVDLDGSTAIRTLGRPAKLALVRDARAVLVTRAEAAGVSLELVIDTGQRDKTFLVLPAQEARELALLGELLRNAIGTARFALPGADEARITATVGAVTWSADASALEMMTTARDTVVSGKRRGGDTVVCGDADVAPGPDGSDRLWRGLVSLGEKYGPIWYWVVDRRGEHDIADHRPHGPTTVPAPAQAFFEAMVADVRREAADEWVAAPASNTHDPRLERPWAEQVLAGPAARRGRSRSQLVAEAYRLADLHDELWTTS